ncbi:MAG TPA: hypothetical protein VGL72_27575, partial [Bryobacteraceae bacterium]
MQRVVPAGWGRRIVSAGKWIALAAMLVVFVPFIAQQVQQALYPQVEFVGNDGSLFPFAPVIRTMGRSSEPGAAAAPAEPTSANQTAASTDTIRRKLERIIIPKLEFREATVSEALEFLKKRSVELDDDSPPGDKGVNIVLKTGELPNEIPQLPGMGNPNETRITVSLTNIPLIEALKYVTGLANLKFRIEPYAVSVIPLSEPTDVLVTKEWKIPPDLIPNSSAPNAVKDWLIANGVSFNGAAAATYVAKSSRLIVRNTQDQLDLIDTITSTGGMGAPSAPSAAPALPGVSRASENLSYDAKARIQTGPGVPNWTWRTVNFGWNGPVTASQQVHPILISLTLERLLTVLRVVLLLGLAAVLLGVRKMGGPGLRAGRLAAAMLLFCGLATNASAQNQIPDQSTIEKLRERLLETSDAYPHAADIPSATITLTGQKMIIETEVHTAIRTAVPVPGKLPSWSPVTVLVDNNPEVKLRRDDGYLWIVVDAGVHHLYVEGSLANVTDWDWTYLLKPRQVKIEAPDWTFNGVKPGGIPEDHVLFTRKQKVVADQASYDRQRVQVAVAVDRSVELGLIWQVHNTVTRLSSPGKATVLRIPLLTGESVVSSGAIVKE